MNFSDLMWILTLFPLGYFLGGNVRAGRVGQLIAACLLPAAALLVPINGLNIVGYLASVLYDPSFALVLTCVCVAFRSRLSPLFDEFTAALLRLRVIIFLSGVSLYPMALGLGYFDPYALFYRPQTAFVVALIACGMWMGKRHLLIAVWLTCSLVAHRFDLGESDNLFDYLLDPIAFAVASISICCRLIRTWRFRNATC